MEVCSNELCHSTPRGKMHLLWEKLMLKLISGSHWIYALKDQLRNISNVYFTFNWFRAFRVVASVEQMLLCYYQVNLLMWLLSCLQILEWSQYTHLQSDFEDIEGNFLFQTSDVRNLLMWLLSTKIGLKSKHTYNFSETKFFKLKWRFMKDKSTENCFLSGSLVDCDWRLE